MQKHLEHLIENLSLDIKNYTHKLKSTSSNQLSLETKRWGNLDFVEHFYKGRGRSVSLSEIGHLYEIQRAARADGMFDRFKTQLAPYAARVKNGYFSHSFIDNYNFIGVEFSHGRSVIEGTFHGYVELDEKLTKMFGENLYTYEGTVDVQFSDEFKEPIDIPNVNLFGTPFDIEGEWTEYIKGTTDERGYYT